MFKTKYPHELSRHRSVTVIISANTRHLKCFYWGSCTNRPNLNCKVRRLREPGLMMMMMMMMMMGAGSRGPLDDLLRWITAFQALQMDAASYHSGDSGSDQLITRAHVINEREETPRNPSARRLVQLLDQDIAWSNWKTTNWDTKDTVGPS